MQDAWHRESLVLKGINTYYDRTQLSNFGGQTATFQINYKFKEIGEPQNYDQGQNYSATVAIEIVSAN